MSKITDFFLTPEEYHINKDLRKFIAKALKVRIETISFYKILKRSIDARSSFPKILLRVEVYIKEAIPEKQNIEVSYKDVSKSPEAVIVGAGPAGLFAALKLIEKGIKPIIIERGKKVSERCKDIVNLETKSILNPESNYCFGEGGAGTYSDGKLYTTATKRGNVGGILNTFIAFGANDDITVDAHPHIGSDKLPGIIANMRKKIIECGGEFYFENVLSDIVIKNNTIAKVVTNKNSFDTNKLILAAGHSAKDIYYLLAKHNIEMEAKPFAVGVRVEHPQNLIDALQYHTKVRSEFLPPAIYKLTAHAEDRGVFSFCMCPGGYVVMSSTQAGHLVVNGMSLSDRSSEYANSGIVVQIMPEDINSGENVFNGIKLQEKLEEKFFVAGGENYNAPAQKLDDFVNKRNSYSLNDSSYKPGLTNSNLNDLMPETISRKLRLGFKEFESKKRGFVTNEAMVIGIETRTSSPIRIVRDNDTLEHISVKGLYPCGEGAGYAGGIISSAIDGEKCAEALAQNY